MRSLPVLGILGVVAAALLCLLPLLASGAPLPPLDNEFGRTCNYTARNVSTELFFTSSRFKSLFPLEDESYALSKVDQPWKACFSSSEPYDLEAIRAGNKLPCFYSRTQWGTVDYWEEHACETSLKSNCYCFAVNRHTADYCQPGAATIDQSNEPDSVACEWYVNGLIADGAVQIDRDTVYSKAPNGHYVALAVSPGIRYGDYHFWRLDSDGSWANKPGTYLPRRTYGDNAKITDVEDAAVRGRYKDFCGYFEVFPETHKVKGSNYWSYNLPDRFEAWEKADIRRASTPLDRISRGWRLAYKEFWQTESFDEIPNGEEGSRRRLHSMAKKRKAE